MTAGGPDRVKVLTYVDANLRDRARAAAVASQTSLSGCMRRALAIALAHDEKHREVAG